MSRIATIAVVLTMVAAPASFAAQDLRAPDQQVTSSQPAVTQIDLRSPDAVDTFVSPSVSSQPSSSGGSDVSPWAITGVIAAALAACVALVAMFRRHRQIGGPLGA